MKSKKKVLLGLSGGVDSSVAAVKLLEQGYDVTGIYMKNVDGPDTDYLAAKEVADSLGIRLIKAELRDKFKNKVIKHFLEGFENGITPHPCVVCNREFKFKAFMDYVKEEDFDYLSMGHYARIKHENGKSYLLKGVDPSKDQTYFLCLLSQEQVSHTIFPVGEMKKTDVRKFAKERNLFTAEKKDSLDVCFVNTNNFSDYLLEELGKKPGWMVTPSGVKIKKHDGIYFYTIGQRKGLEVGGMPEYEEKPWYVVGKNIEKNELIIDQGLDSSSLLSRSLIIEKPNWITDTPLEDKEYEAKFRYRGNTSTVTVEFISNGSVKINFPQGARAITLGQACVLYDGDIVLGGGEITKINK